MKYIAESLKDSKKIAQELLRLLKKHKLNTIAFTGDLGSGKTTITQMIGQELGIKSIIQSPTFVIMREYEIFPPKKSVFSQLIHIDAYRIDAKDTNILDLDILLSTKNTLIIIEWADRIKTVLPQRYLDVQIKMKEKARVFTTKIVDKFKE